MSRKAAILSALLLISLINFIAVAVAQDSVPQLITLSTDELNFLGTEGVTNLSQTLRIVGIGDEKVNVTLFSADLYDSSSGKTISFNEMNIVPDLFSLSRNEEKAVNIMLNTLGVSAGTYQGTILVTATTTTTITETKIKVITKIKIENPWISQWGPLIATLIVIAIALNLPEEKKERKFLNRARDFLNTHYSKKFFLVFLGMLSVFLWFLSLVTSSFGDPSNIISTILIGPFVGYVIYYVKDKREETKEKEKASRALLTGGIEKDIELLRNLLGETTSHFASFNSKYYHKSGLLSREAWDKSSKEGLISDIPTGRIAKYYGFVDLHNAYYSCVMKLSTEKDKNKSETSEASQLISLFEAFRKKYLDLETILFVNLSYDIGLFGATYLSPLPVGYPRVSGTLVFKLKEYGVLKPSDYEENDVSFKNKIEERDTNLLEKICANIYRSENTSKILVEINEHFDQTYKELEECVKKLPSLPKECAEKKKKERPIVKKGAFVLEVDSDEKQNRQV